MPIHHSLVKWSKDLAYCIGLIATDGSLSKDGRHIVFTTKDEDLVELFVTSLDLHAKISTKSRKPGGPKDYFFVQFSNVSFYDFLLSIGLMPNKTKILGELKIPDRYFSDFLRGHFDGDGTFYDYWDKRWKSSHLFYLVFISASKNHILWLRQKIMDHFGVKGHINQNGTKVCYQLKFGKREALPIIKGMFGNFRVKSLGRKRLKIQRVLSIIKQ